MLDTIKNFIIGKSREEELSPYADALNAASAARNTAAKQQEYAKNWLVQNPNYGDQSFTSAMQQIASDDYLKQYEDQLSEYQNIWDKAKKQQEWNVAGSGLLGGMLNSALQSGSATTDLQKSGLKEWQEGRRDALSDVGAGIDTGLTIASFIPGVGLAKGATATAKAAPTLGKTILKGAGRGALYGGIGSLGNYLQTTGNEATLGNAALSSAIGAGTGGLLGGGLSGLGYGIGRLTSTPNKQAISQAMSDYAKSGGADKYQQALQTLNNAGLDTASEEALKKSYRTFALANHPDKIGVANADIFDNVTQAKNVLTGRGVSNTGNFTENIVKASAPVKGLDLSSIPRVGAKSWQEAVQNAKNNLYTSKLYERLYSSPLKNIGGSKLGKAAAIGATAYGISRLLGNRNGGNNE